ncbi:hypothetical protein D9M68_973330 [compost metagenome]
MSADLDSIFPGIALATQEQPDHYLIHDLPIRTSNRTEMQGMGSLLAEVFAFK